MLTSSYDNKKATKKNVKKSSFWHTGNPLYNTSHNLLLNGTRLRSWQYQAVMLTTYNKHNTPFQTSPTYNVPATRQK